MFGSTELKSKPSKPPGCGSGLLGRASCSHGATSMDFPGRISRVQWTRPRPGACGGLARTSCSSVGSEHRIEVMRAELPEHARGPSLRWMQGLRLRRSAHALLGLLRSLADAVLDATD